MGIIRHNYINASDDVAQYVADQCGRQAVTVSSFFEDPIISDRLCDATVFRFLIEDYECGLDPWRIVTIDKFVEGRAPDPSKPYIMSNSVGTRDWPVSADEVVFIQKFDLVRAGVEIPESRYEEFRRMRDL